MKNTFTTEGMSWIRFSACSPVIRRHLIGLSQSRQVLIRFHGATAHSRPVSPHYRGFTITLRHTVVRRTPLDEWSARPTNLYLTTQNTSQERDNHAVSEIWTRNAASERPQTYASEPAASGIGQSATPSRKPENLPRESETQSDELKEARLLECGNFAENLRLNRKIINFIPANLTLCAPWIILQCVDDQRDAQFL